MPLIVGNTVISVVISCIDLDNCYLALIQRHSLLNVGASFLHTAAGCIGSRAALIQSDTLVCELWYILSKLINLRFDPALIFSPGFHLCIAPWNFSCPDCFLGDDCWLYFNISIEQPIAIDAYFGYHNLVIQLGKTMPSCRGSRVKNGEIP